MDEFTGKNPQSNRTLEISSRRDRVIRKGTPLKQFRDTTTGRFVKRSTYERSRAQLRSRTKRLGVKYLPGRYVASTKVAPLRDPATGLFIPKAARLREPFRVNWIELWDLWSKAQGEKRITLKGPGKKVVDMKASDPLLKQSAVRLELRNTLEGMPKHRKKSWQIAPLFLISDDEEGLQIDVGF